MSFKVSQGHRSLHKMKTPISYPLLEEYPPGFTGYLPVYRNHDFQSRAFAYKFQPNFDLCAFYNLLCLQ